jgi:hypothetical protein
MPEILDWPELNEMTKEEIISLIQSVRQYLCYAEECICVDLAELLKVDVRV